MTDPSTDIAGFSDYPALLANLKSRIRSAHVRAAISTAGERDLLNWE